MWPRNTTMLDIPHEILAVVCQELPQPDVVALLTTCKYIRQLLRGQHLQLRIYIRNRFPTNQQINPRIASLYILTDAASAADSLQFCTDFGPVIGGIRMLRQYIPLETFRELVVLYAEQSPLRSLPVLPSLFECIATSSHLGDIANLQMCTQLTRLAIDNTDVADITPLQSCDTLRVLKIPLIRNIAPICGHLLRELTIGSPGVRPFGDIVLPPLPVTLTHLAVHATVDSFDVFAPLVNLRVLIIAGVALNRPTMNFTRNLRHLHTLSVCNTAVADVSGLANCPDLQTLSLNILVDAANLSMLTACVRLQHLALACMGEQPAAFQLPDLVTFSNILATCTTLPCLKYSPNVHTLNITNSWVSELPRAAYLHSLRRLDISHSLVTSIDDFRMPQLREFDMSFTMIRDITALADSPLLTNLHMQSSHVADILPLLECSRLECIDMADCLCLREAYVLLRLPVLRSVDFSNCKLANENVLIGTLTQGGVQVTVL